MTSSPILEVNAGRSRSAKFPVNPLPSANGFTRARSPRLAPAPRPTERVRPSGPDDLGAFCVPGSIPRGCPYAAHRHPVRLYPVSLGGHLHQAQAPRGCPDIRTRKRTTSPVALAGPGRRNRRTPGPEMFGSGGSLFWACAQTSYAKCHRIHAPMTGCAATVDNPDKNMSAKSSLHRL